MTNVGLKELNALNNLTKIDLAGTKVTDAGVKEFIAHHKLKLTRLHLGSIPITDATLKELATVRNLRELHLGSTQVTNEGVKAFMKALPNCYIWDWKAK